jgi:hypothetical protein
VGYEQGATVQLDAAARPQVRHAVKKTVLGPIAMCGAGPIKTRLLGSFNSTGKSACSECVELLTAT